MLLMKWNDFSYRKSCPVTICDPTMGQSGPKIVVMELLRVVSTTPNSEFQILAMENSVW